MKNPSQNHPARKTLLNRLVIALAALTVGIGMPLPASAHLERPTEFPSGGTDAVFQTNGPYLVVCDPADSPRLIDMLAEPSYRDEVAKLFQVCLTSGFDTIQAAVNAVTERGTRILVLPGYYIEAPSLAPLTMRCEEVAALPRRSYDEQLECPNGDNLIAILGDGPDADYACDYALCDLIIMGMGDDPGDVLVDAGFNKLNVFRADRADGFIVRNLTVERALFSGVYILETDGFAIIDTVSHSNVEYGFLTFTVDHGLYQNCEAYFNGEGGLYPGSAAPLLGGRPAVVVDSCLSHHNFTGLAGTAANSLYVLNSQFYENAVGIALDSLFQGHPGLPQGFSTFEGNLIYDNNLNPYVNWEDGTCLRPIPRRGIEHGILCPILPSPFGTGVVLAGGNQNLFIGNWIWGHNRYGIMQFWVPAEMSDTPDPLMRRAPRDTFDTSHGNRYEANYLGIAFDTSIQPNSIDVWWDGEGEGNCWERTTSRTDPVVVPDCSSPSAWREADPVKFAQLIACLAWRPSRLHPPMCPWF